MRALVATALFSVGLVVGGTQPAAGLEPTVVISPDHVIDGQRLGMDISGFPAGYSGLVQCSGSVLQPDTQPTAVCALLQVVASGSPPPSHVDWTVVSSFTAYDGVSTVDCYTDPAGCVAGIVTISDPDDVTTVIARAYAPLTFLPQFSGVPDRQLTDGATIAVEGDHVPPGDWSIAQCGRAVVDDPTPAGVEASCGPSTAVTVAADGAFQAALTVHDPLMSRSNARVPCGSSGCVVVLASADAPVVRAFGIAFGPTTLAVEPDTDIVEPIKVHVTVTGAPDDVVVMKCVLPVGPTRQDSRCDYYEGAVPLDDWGAGALDVEVSAVVRTDVEEHDCRALGCALVLFDQSGARIGQPAPISFAPPASLTLEPSEGLLEGQEMVVTVERVIPGGQYGLLHCGSGGFGCNFDSAPIVVASPEGTIQARLPALQRFGPSFGRVYCRAECEIMLFPAIGTSGPYVAARYAMAEGEVSVTPATGLDDGQQVQMTGTELMPTYPGAPVGPFPTGGWALTQCDSVILDQPDLLGVFTHCSIAPPSRAVTIDGSTLDTTVDVKATISKILGGTTDCAAAPDACVVGLVRLEQDRSLSTHLVPVTFG